MNRCRHIGYGSILWIAPLFSPVDSTCIAGNTAPQISGQGETFAVNMPCTDAIPAFSAVGSLTLSFSATSVTGTVGTPSAPSAEAALVLSTANIIPQLQESFV